MPIGTYMPPPGKSITEFFFPNFFIYFFHFRCILLQISHQKCFFISISIPGRSGVKDFIFLKIFKDFKDPWGPCFTIMCYRNSITRYRKYRRIYIW